MGKIFFEKTYTKLDRETIFRLFSKISKWGISMVQTFVNFVFIIYKFEDYRNILKTRLAFTRSFDLRGNLGNVKKNK